MTAFQKTVIGFGTIIGLYWFIAWHRPTMQVVYPDSCSFVIDPAFSAQVQQDIRKFIDQAYELDKNPSQLLYTIEARFSEIKSIVIDMKNPEFLTCTIQAYTPLFMINQEHVVCEGGRLLPLSIFSDQIITGLKNISFEQPPTPEHVDRLMQFFTSVDSAIFQDFLVRWINKHAIWLDQKQQILRQDLSLLVGYDTMPTKDDVAVCRNLRGQISDTATTNKRGKQHKNNQTWVCDLRFDRQIIMFSTNRGV